MSLIRHWHSTPAERGADFPCDAFITDPDDILFRAIDIAAPPAVVFRWLCQLRAAPYSYDWIDNAGRTSPRALTPGLEQLAVGQRVMGIFTLVAFARDQHVTLMLHRGHSWFGDVAVTYRVTPAPGGTRLVAKVLVKRPHGAMRLVAPLLPAGDLVMMRKQLRTLKRLAEQTVH